MLLLDQNFHFITEKVPEFEVVFVCLLTFFITLHLFDFYLLELIIIQVSSILYSDKIVCKILIRSLLRIS